MKEIPYKSFSLQVHQKKLLKQLPSVCQFELTFGCALHCLHCYSDCYNQAKYLKDELSTAEIKSILDKLFQGGVVWLCFTGGDPLFRKDFLEIYAYAKEKGFIVSLFTSAVSLNSEIARYLGKYPPFVIELTMHAAEKEAYEKVSRVKGSYARAIKGIKLLRRAKLPLKIKMQLSLANLKELPSVKKYIRAIGLKFKPSPLLFARLNQDKFPCSLRISPQEVLKLKTQPNKGCLCSDKPGKEELFICSAGQSDGIYIDPYGRLVPCMLIREPGVELLKIDLAQAMQTISNWVKLRRFVGEAKCRGCKLRSNCHNCPGRALLETGDIEGVVPYFCDLAHLVNQGAG